MSPETLRLYLVTDFGLCPPKRLLELIPGLVEAGVTVVQLRDKHLPARELVEVARAFRARLRPVGVPLLVNDRADVAFAAEADGVHLGQSDLHPVEARRLLGPTSIVGVSLESAEPGTLRGLDAADYLAASPVWATPSKTDTAPPLGLEGVRALRRLDSRPLVGIGGIGTERAGAVRAAGADGVAVISAILGAEDPVEATRRLRTALDGPAPEELDR